MSQELFYSEVLATLNARRLVLSLLNVSGREQEPIAHLVAAGELFGIEPASIRMAVGRLTKDGLLVSEARGRYAIGPKAAALRERLRGWKHALSRTKPWQGDWLAVHTSHLGRTDRKQLRGRTRALNLLGFAEALPGLWLRPANLLSSLTEMRARLVSIGLDEQALVLHIGSIEGDDRFRPEKLWPTDELEPRYRRAIASMAESTSEVASLSGPKAARETLLVGQTVLHYINLDPLLPEQLVDRSLLTQMIEDMRAYNRLGLDCWQKFYDQVDQPAERKASNADVATEGA